MVVIQNAACCPSFPRPAFPPSHPALKTEGLRIYQTRLTLLDGDHGEVEVLHRAVPVRPSSNTPDTTSVRRNVTSRPISGCRQISRPQGAFRIVDGLLESWVGPHQRMQGLEGPSIPGTRVGDVRAELHPSNFIFVAFSIRWRGVALLPSGNSVLYRF